MERFSSLVTKSRPWPVIGRTIFFTSDKNRPTRDEIYFIDFWRENLSMYRIKVLHQQETQEGWGVRREAIFRRSVAFRARVHLHVAARYH